MDRNEMNERELNKLKKRRELRRKKMRRRRILFYVLVVVFVLGIYSGFKTTKNKLSKPQVLSTNDRAIWYIKNKLYPIKESNEILNILTPEKLGYEVVGVVNGVKKVLVKGSNHITNASSYAYDTKEIRQYIRGEREYKGNDKLVFLTFDDGPNNKITPQVLDILKRNKVHATFFVVGKSIVENHYQVLKRTLMEGHSLGLHSFTHDYSLLYPNRIADPNKVVEEVSLTQGRLQKVFGEDFKSQVFRYPGGHMSWQNVTASDAAIANIGVEWIDWNSLSGDAERKVERPTTVDEEVNYVIKSLNKNLHQKVAVVLMHDALNKQLTVDSLQKIIDYFKENDYKFCILK